MLEGNDEAAVLYKGQFKRPNKNKPTYCQLFLSQETSLWESLRPKWHLHSPYSERGTSLCFEICFFLFLFPKRDLNR